MRGPQTTTSVGCLNCLVRRRRVFYPAWSVMVKGRYPCSLSYTVCGLFYSVAICNFRCDFFFFCILFYILVIITNVSPPPKKKEEKGEEKERKNITLWLCSPTPNRHLFPQWHLTPYPQMTSWICAWKNKDVERKYIMLSLTIHQEDSRSAEWSELDLRANIRCALKKRWSTLNYF